MRRLSILTLFGTRPEAIKLAPVLLLLERLKGAVRTVNVSSGQHADLLDPLIQIFGLRVDYDLNLMSPNQSPGDLLARIVSACTRLVNSERPDWIVVQGDTTTALAGALVGRRCGVPVAHVEAGLRSGNLQSPYPEEINRLLIAQMADLHFAATEANRNALLREGVGSAAIHVTGNPIVDAIQRILPKATLPDVPGLCAALAGRKCIVLTTHRRESFGCTLRGNLEILRDFVAAHEDTVLVFPVHPNPNVRIAAQEILEGAPRVFLTPPLPYLEFLGLLSRCWLVVSDSGGIQEEVPSLGKPLLILRENTERPECIEAGMARLVGGGTEKLMTLLEEAHRPGSWVNSVHEIVNPFGQGDSAIRIVQHLVRTARAKNAPSFDVARNLRTAPLAGASLQTA